MTIGLIHNESSMLRIPASMSVTKNLLPATIILSQSLVVFHRVCPEPVLRDLASEISCLTLIVASYVFDSIIND